MEIDEGSPPRTRRDRRWYRDLEVLDAYDADRVCSEGLADDLTNELLRGPRRTPVRRGYSFTAPSTR